mgnify:CR=1 FL=1
MVFLMFGKPEFVNHAPVAALTVSPLIGYAPLEVTFDARGTTDEDEPDDVLRYRFDFDGDGQWDTEFDIQPLVVHTMEVAGNFVARVEVVDQGGESSEASAEQELEVAAPLEEGDLTVNVLVDSNRDGLVDELDVAHFGVRLLDLPRQVSFRGHIRPGRIRQRSRVSCRRAHLGIDDRQQELCRPIRRSNAPGNAPATQSERPSQDAGHLFT